MSFDVECIILDKDLTAEKLDSEIKNIVKNKKSLEQMGKNAEKVKVLNVQEKIYNEIKAVQK